ncbi:MAG: hypothetical protein B6D61_07485 [Bacteroidetes bacterium 4484_249]|nr:MAG: hypothetical protein B6D61_07485 [Bacteroidetes bacterium 4484_249]
MKDLILKLLIQLIAVSIPFLILILDYIWNDRRTKKFKTIRRILIALSVLFIIGSVYLIYNDHFRQRQLEYKNNLEQKQIKEFYKNQIKLLTQTNESVNTTMRITDSIIHRTNSILKRTDLMNKDLNYQLSKIKYETKALRYPVTDNFYCDILRIKFKDKYLVNSIDSLIPSIIEKNHGMSFYGINTNSEFERSISAIAYNKYNQMEVRLIIEKAEKKLIMKSGKFDIHQDSVLQENFNNFSKSVAPYMSDLIYWTENKHFEFLIKNIPFRVTKNEGFRSIIELWNSDVTVEIEIYSKLKRNELFGRVLRTSQFVTVMASDTNGFQPIMLYLFLLFSGLFPHEEFSKQLLPVNGEY